MRSGTILTFISLIVQTESGPLVHGRNREGTLVVALTIGRFDQVDSESRSTNHGGGLMFITLFVIIGLSLRKLHIVFFRELPIT